MSPLEAAPVPPELRTLRIAVLVAGGIAAYKVADLVSQLVQAGALVRVAMTPAAQRFVGPATFQGLTGTPVLTDLWSGTGAEPHVHLGDWAQVALLAPATANVIAQLAAGEAGDPVTATALALRGPLVVGPAMNDAMWAKPAVQQALERLRAQGAEVVPPASGRLASGHVGPGRLAGAEALLTGLRDAVRRRYDLAGRRVVVTAGGTRERIDPVRFIGNFSSGKMGYAVAAAAAERGAGVVLVSTAQHPAHPGVEVRSVESGAEMLAALQAALPGADLLVMAAAVADFKPGREAAAKLRREELNGLHLDLERNLDVLGELSRDPRLEDVFKLGFAAETGDALPRAREKLARKGLAGIVANDVSRRDAGFGSDLNAGTLLLADGTELDLPLGPKREMADRILDALAPRLRPQ